MWYLRAFERHGDRLIKSYPLNDVGIGAIRRLFPGRSDAELVGLSWPVKPDQAGAIEELTREQLTFDKFDYFIDFYAAEAAQNDKQSVLARAELVISPIPVTTVQFMNEIAAVLPTAARVIHARRREERGEILPHMEMSELIDWAGETYAASQMLDESGRRARREIMEFLRLLEERFEVGDQDIDDLIATSFLEGLVTTGASLPGLRSLLGPRMLAWYRTECEGDDS
jgi:hypothetical protein